MTKIFLIQNHWVTIANYISDIYCKTKKPVCTWTFINQATARKPSDLASEAYLASFHTAIYSTWLSQADLPFTAKCATLVCSFSYSQFW
jgi:hypothetical protein